MMKLYANSSKISRLSKMLDELYAVTFVLPTNDDKLKKEAIGGGGGEKS